MVAESRVLLFETAEVRIALEPLLKARQLRHFAHEPTNILVERNAEGELLVHMIYVGTAARRTFSDTQVTAALVHFCMTQNIPLPMNLTKRLEYRGGHLALVVGEVPPMSAVPSLLSINNSLADGPPISEDDREEALLALAGIPLTCEPADAS